MNEPLANYFFRTETNQRSNNEDSLDRSELSVYGEAPITLLSLADGMGGYEHGEEISKEGLRRFKLMLRRGLKTAESPLDVDRLKQALLDALQLANTDICQTIANNNWHKAGSTLVAAVIWQNRLVATNLGDSPLFHYEAATGKLVKVTLDHSVVGILAQAGIITEEMARHHDRRGQLEYFLGCPNVPNPLPVYDRELRSGDLVMLCSDGINGLLRLAQIEQILARTDTSLERKAEELIHAARVAGEQDNQSVMLWCQPSISEPQCEPPHNQPRHSQDLMTIAASSPRGREIDAVLGTQEIDADVGSPDASPLHRDKAPWQRRSTRKSSVTRTLLWATCGSVITLAAATIAGWDTTGNLLKSIPKQLDGLLNGAPKPVPTEIPQNLPPELPKKLAPDRDPIEIRQAIPRAVKRYLPTDITFK